MALAGCERAGGDGGGAKKLNVVATTTMIGDLVQQIAGDRVELRVLMGAGVDPHTFKPSTSDLGAVSRGDVVFYNGLHLEGKMVELLEGKLKEKAFAVSGGIDKGELLSWAAGEQGAHDPHVWFDVSMWAKAARVVGDRLAEADAGNAGEYRKRTAEVVARMGELHEWVKGRIGTIPEGQRVLITSHDAYNYFGRAYGIRVMGIQGISTESEAGLASINNAVEFILKNRIPAIFVESSVSPKTIERVRDDAKARGVEVRIGGELFSDAMGEKGSHGGYAVETYEGMVRWNVDTVVRGLGGSHE
jgi:manganese/zinc/iron transport system substrate-binding protein